MPPERASDRDAAPAAEAPAEPGLSLYRRLMEWVRTHRRKAILLTVAGLISLSVTVTGLRMLMRPAAPKEPPTLNAAFAALDAGNYDDARQRVDEYVALVPEEASGGADFIRGAAAAYSAVKNHSVEQDRFFLVAANYLKKPGGGPFPMVGRGKGCTCWASACS